MRSSFSLLPNFFAMAGSCRFWLRNRKIPCLVPAFQGLGRALLQQYPRTRLFCPFVKVRRGVAPPANGRIGVPELLCRQRLDVSVWDTPSQLGNVLAVDGLLPFIDRVGAKDRQAPLIDGLILFGSTGQAIVGGNLGNVACHMNLRKVTIGRENEDTPGRVAEGQRPAAAIGRGDFGQHEGPISCSRKVLADCASAGSPRLSRVKTASSHCAICRLSSHS